MTMNGHGEGISCPICRKMKPAREIVPGVALNDTARQSVQAVYPYWAHEDLICTSCLAQVLAHNAPLPDDLDDEFASERLYQEMNRRRSFGERVSDRVASFVGSWAFLVTQVVLLVLWIAFNALMVVRYRFDPYPFIFLNLVLSWIAALQAPLILMSQNRQDARDRYRDEVEYRTNISAEHEIRLLHKKIDQLIAEQHPLLAEIAQHQVQLLEQLAQSPADGTPRRKRAS